VAFIIGLSKGGMFMKKSKIIRHFMRMPDVEQKEKFMEEHNIKFAYDSFHNMTVWAEDGTLQLFPIKREV
jgi:hypothetical protein